MPIELLKTWVDDMWSNWVLRCLAGIGALVVFSCGSPTLEFTAHRGASYDAPENTLAAFNLAWEQGADAIEGDFYLTNDGKIVCIHDKSALRTAGVDLDIAASTLAQLRNLDFGSWKDVKWRSEKIPTLEEVIATIPENKKLFIEIKCGPEIIPELKKTIENSTLTSGQIIIISFSREVIAAAKQALPQINAFWLTSFNQTNDGNTWEPSIGEILVILKDIQADGLDCRAHESIDEIFVKELK
ncbi:MAG: glycerophosphodiester phosphodiesterase, partial [Calditrichales bacterium]